MYVLFCKLIRFAGGIGNLEAYANYLLINYKYRLVLKAIHISATKALNCFALEYKTQCVGNVAIFELCNVTSEI